LKGEWIMSNNQPRKKLRPSGSDHLRAAGKIAVYLGVSADDMALVDAACEIQKRSRASFVAYYAVEAAKRIVGNHKEQPL
jgi:uncharacterized protein (DUF1778 family)